MEWSKQTGREDSRFDKWFDDLEERYRTKWVYSLCRYVWQNLTYNEFELWFDNNAQELYQRAVDLEKSDAVGVGTLNLEPFSPPGRIALGYQELWDTEPLSKRTQENWRWLRDLGNSKIFEQFVLENQPYRVRLENVQDLHIREFFAIKGQQVPEIHLVEDWYEFYYNLPVHAATVELLTEIRNNIRRTIYTPPGIWWADINPSPATAKEFINALCQRLLAEVDHYKASQDLYPFRHSTYLGFRLPNRWRNWWANSEVKYRTSYLWRYSMANLKGNPQEMVQRLANDEEFRSDAFKDFERPAYDNNLSNPTQQPPTYEPNLDRGEGSFHQLEHGTNYTAPFASAHYESTSTDFAHLDQEPRGTIQPPNLQSPLPKGYSCLPNSVAEAAPRQIEQNPLEKAAHLFNSRNKPRLIGLSKEPIQGVGNYGWWGRYVDDGPQKKNEPVENYVERVNRARDNMRIQLRLRPEPPLRDQNEPIEKYAQKLQAYENRLESNERIHNNRMNEQHPQFDQKYRDEFQQIARAVHTKNEARRTAARQYWDSEVARLHSSGNHKQEKTAELYRNRYRVNEDVEADMLNLYEGWKYEDILRGEQLLSTDEEDPDADNDSDSDDPNSAQMVNRKRPNTRNSLTRGPYLVSWWARELPDVPRAPAPPDHWAVRARRMFADYPRPAQAASTQGSLFPQSRRGLDDRGTATPSGAESGSTGPTLRSSRVPRSDRGKGHRYPRSRQPARSKQSTRPGRQTSRSRSASPRSTPRQSYKARSPIGSMRKCQRCVKRNRTCSAEIGNKRPCQECIMEGPEIARLCVGRMTRSNSGFASAPGGHEPDEDHGGMDLDDPTSSNLQHGQGGGYQTGYGDMGSFQGF